MADRYWVGGTATWDGTAGSKWDTTSGGAGGAAVPTAADDVFLDAASGAVTVTLGGSPVARSLNCTGFTGTINHATGVGLVLGDATAGASNIALKLVAGMTYTVGNQASSSITYVSTSTTVQTIDTAAKSTGSFAINGAGSRYQLSSSNTVGAGTTVTLTTGELDTNGQTISWPQFSSNNSNTRTLTLGASTITLNTTSGTVWNITTGTNLTLNAGTSVINSANGVTFQGGGKTYNEVNFTSNGSVTIGGANTFAVLRRTNTDLYAQMQLNANQTVTTTLVLTGNNATTRRMLITSARDPAGTQRTITCNGSITLTNVDFQWIVGAGSGTWSGTSVGNAVGNSGITFTTPVTRYWVGNGGNWPDTSHWSTSSGGASGASMPICHDFAIFDANSFSSGSQTISQQAGGGTPNPMRCCDMDFTGVTNTPQLLSSIETFYYGNMKLVPGMTLASSGFNRSFMGNPTGGTQNITMAGLQWHNSTTDINAGSQAITFLDAFSSLGQLNYRSGTWTATADVTASGVFFNGGFTRTLNMGSGTWLLTGTGTWSGSSFGGTTINSDTSTIKMTDNSATNKTFGFSAGTYTYNKLWIATAGAGRVEIFRANTFTTLQIDAGAIVRFPSATTQTIGTWTVNGASGNVVTIDSSTAASAATLTKPSGTVSSDWLSLKDSTATGGATWYAGANSTNVSGNSGWIFSAPPSPGGTALMMGI